MRVSARPRRSRARQGGAWTLSVLLACACVIGIVVLAGCSGSKPAYCTDRTNLDNAVNRLTRKITAAVGSMWCAYVFAAITLFGFPSAIREGLGGVVQWIAQTFLQLVVLSIIIVGQNVQAAGSDERAQDIYQAAEAVLHEALQIQEHLLTQDRELERLITTLCPRRRGDDDRSAAAGPGPPGVLISHPRGRFVPPHAGDVSACHLQSRAALPPLSAVGGAGASSEIARGRVNCDAWPRGVPPRS